MIFCEKKIYIYIAENGSVDHSLASCAMISFGSQANICLRLAASISPHATIPS